MVGAALVVAAIAVALTVLRPEPRAAHAREHRLAGGEPAYSEAV